MASATGRFASTLIGFESTYGTAADSGDYFKVPYITSELTAQQPLEVSNILTGRRDASTPDRGDIDVAGNIVVPCDTDAIGLWLKLLFGAPTTTAVSSNYLHTYVSGATTLPSLTHERSHTQRGRLFQHPGVMANTLALSFARGNSMDATIGLIAQNEVILTSSAAGTPEDLTASFRRFSGYNAAVKQGGTQIAGVVNATFNYSNELDPLKTIRNDRKIDGIDIGGAMAEGQITLRWTNNTLLDLAVAETPIALQFELSLDANTFLRFTMGEVHLSKPGTRVTGPGGIEQSFDWKAAYKAADGEMLTVTLQNTFASYA